MSDYPILSATAPTTADVSLEYQKANGKNTFSVEIYGTAGAAKVNFLAAAASDTFRPVTAVQSDGFATGNSGGIGQLWMVDGTGLRTFRVQVESVTGGNVSVGITW